MLVTLPCPPQQPTLPTSHVRGAVQACSAEGFQDRQDPWEHGLKVAQSIILHACPGGWQAIRDSPCKNHNTTRAVQLR
jgi:hypothetical protein